MDNNKENISEYDYHKVPTIEKITEKDIPPKYGYGIRHVQLVIFLLCLTVSIIGRGHMGVTIVAMTSTREVNKEILNTTIHTAKKNDTIEEIMKGNAAGLEPEHIVIKIENATEIESMIYDWPKPIQEMVLNAFFLGYTIMMFPMGMVCQRYGGKLPLQISLLLNAIISILTPWLTVWVGVNAIHAGARSDKEEQFAGPPGLPVPLERVVQRLHHLVNYSVLGGWKATCGCRIIQGLAQAGTYPSVQALLAKWIPTEERASLSCCVYTGLTVGTVIGYQLAGVLGASRWGWPSIFYTIGVICLLCFILLTQFGTATPLEHRSITNEERKYIMGAGREEKTTRKPRTPWRAIVTSVPFWATVTAQTGGNLGFVFFFNQAPTYIHYILGLNVRNSGLLSSLPYIGSIFSTLGFGWLSDYLINRSILSRNNARRICTSISHCGIAVCLILTSYTYNITIAVTCLVASMTLNMAGHTGWLVNFIDLAPNFSGTLTAVGNIFANTFVVLMPIIISHVVTDMTNQVQWRIMFFIIAGLSVISNAVFVLLMSADVQPWNNVEYNEKCVEDTVKEKENEEEQVVS